MIARPPIMETGVWQGRVKLHLTVGLAARTGN